MAVEKITLNLIPTGETPTIHAAQFDKERAFQIELKEGEDDFSPTGYDIELQVRKVDNNIVTAVPSQASSNIVTFLTTEQMTACSGTNLAELQISKNNMSIATLHFYLVVQRDVLAGGLSSQSEIYDLEEQIAAIVPEVIGDEYYTKTETNGLLSQKANTSSLSTVAFTGSYDDLSDKPTIPGNASVLPISASDSTNTKNYIDSGLSGKADTSDTYTKEEVDNKVYNVFPTDTASGSIAHITDGADNIPVKSLVSEIVAVQSGSGTPSSSNPRAISGFDSGVVTVNGNTYTFAFGQTVYGGHFDNKGNLEVNKIKIHIDSSYTFSSELEYAYINCNNLIKALNYTDKIICDKLITSSEQYGMPIGSISGYADKNNLYPNRNWLYFKVAETTTPQIMKDWLDNVGGIDVVYELATPITLSITSQDIPTLLGENNIYSNCGDVEVDYHADIGLYIDKKISSLAQGG